ncbi:NAD(P)/FAD-dependent oxidoreductase [Bacillus sp. FJAT-49711]|uniref:phytoene desaturase family protein n=1 Tax=Bacillus sp. FJAT-49711 TaxID=2833585 RepID=UPI001BCA34E2|nr:NAD(P)/FAD-dependent oxidoreductase [Bacillus sp. FJAT-49711]MBS4220977.1 NAD(P)/FAD-dependent oxidoreductase [Bacillus sp. FJAT-49711]
MDSLKKRYDTAVIGGGLTGLTAAVYLARAGKSVIVLEKQKDLGGLAQTTNVNGALFNLGPHAMYEGGAALRILRELDCLPNGGYASKSGMIGIENGQIVQVPTDLNSDENREWTQLMGGLNEIDTKSILSLSVQDWAEKNILHERVRLFFYAMCKQWSYCDDMSVLSSGFVIEQGQLAGKGVRYVEEGWQTIVDNLNHEAEIAGATILNGYKVRQIIQRSGYVRALLLSDGTELEVSSVISTVGPEETSRFVQGSESLDKWKKRSRPLFASCFDVALKRVAYPERVFALGLDEPLYFSNHSVSVKLSDNGAHIFHLMKYNGNERAHDETAEEKQLTNLLDLLQPGWEQDVVAARFSANVFVAHDSRTIHNGGTAPAPGPNVPEISGLYIAGDWVGPEGRLADAALASAKSAAQEAIKNN